MNPSEPGDDIARRVADQLGAHQRAAALTALEKLAALPPEQRAEVLALLDTLNASRAMRGAPGAWVIGDVQTGD